MKCEVCGREVDLPFRCSFCNGNFCVEHRLPENHSCPQAPPRTPLGHWKAKIRKLEAKELPSLPRRTQAEETPSCPKCASERIQTTAYRRDRIHYECLDCGFKWKGPKYQGKRPIYAKARIRKKSERPSFGIGRIFRVLLGIPIVFGGLIIIFWEIYPSLISSLPVPFMFQIISTVSSLPLPSLFTGVCISLIGVLVLLTKAKAFFVSLMLVVAFAYPFGLDWAFNVNFGEGLVAYLPIAFVLAVCHELLHAMAWWSFGYFAIPIPILIPPILGITIGEKPRRWRENFFVSVAPILLTITSFLLYYTTNDERYSMFGIINLAGMVYDIISIFVW